MLKVGGVGRGKKGGRRVFLRKGRRFRSDGKSRDISGGGLSYLFRLV